MAEPDPVDKAGNFLTHKLGPLPVGVWLVAAIGIFLLVSKRAGKSGTPGAQTDPAGNVGTINPKTGYVYGSSQDTSAMGAASGSGGGGSSGTPSESGSTVAGQYPDNNAWSRAAINFLVGVGVDPTSANSAIEQYITSQTLTTDQQGQVNLAIQSIGAPPVPPTPGTSPPPVVTPPGGGTVYATNPVTGLMVTDKSSSTIGLRWNTSTNANAYTVAYSTGNAPEESTTVPGTAARTMLTGLQPDALYNIRVQATPAKQGAGFAQTSASTAAAPAPAAPSQPVPAPDPAYQPPPLDTHPSNQAGARVEPQPAPPPGGIGTLPGYYGGDLASPSRFWDGRQWIYT